MKNLLFVLVTVFGLTACGGGGGSSSGGGTGGSGGNRAPSASFTVACADLDCTFTNNSTDSDGTIASSSWNFGDGNSSSETSPSHTYNSFGSFTITLTVTDNGGLSRSTTRSVSVSIDVHNRTATIDLGNGSVLFSQDFSGRTDGDYTIFNYTDDMCVGHDYDNLPYCGSQVQVNTDMSIESGRLKIDFAPDAQNGIGFTRELGTEYNELYMTYIVEFAENFDFETDLKILGLAGNLIGEQIPGGGNRGTGPDSGFNSRYVMREGELKQYVYHPDQPASFGDSDYVQGFEFRKGQEYVVEMRVKMNTVGNNDGEIETFINGVSVLLIDDYSFSQSGIYGVNKFVTQIFISETLPVANTSTMYLDDIAVSQERIVIPD